MQIMPESQSEPRTLNSMMGTSPSLADPRKCISGETLRQCNLFADPSGSNGFSARTRASEHDRIEAQGQLNEAFAEGALDQGEFDARSEALIQAKLREHLVFLVADLPIPHRRVKRQQQLSAMPRAWRVIPEPIKWLMGTLTSILQFIIIGFSTGAFHASRSFGATMITSISGVIGTIIGVLCFMAMVASIDSKVDQYRSKTTEKLRNTPGWPR